MDDEKDITEFQFSSTQLKNLLKTVFESVETRQKEIGLSKKSKNPKTQIEKKQVKEPSFLLKFPDPNEAKLINRFRQEALAKNEHPNKLLKNLILDTLMSENTIKSYSMLKNDIYYALRKGIYTSLSPFYLRLEENNIEIEHKFDLLNYKLNLVINLLLEKMEKSQFSLSESKLEDLVLFKSIKDQQEQEYLLLKKKNQARKIEIKKAYENFLKAEQIDQILNDDTKLTSSTKTKRLKSILEYLNEIQNKKPEEKTNNKEVENEETKEKE